MKYRNSGLNSAIQNKNTTFQNKTTNLRPPLKYPVSSTNTNIHTKKQILQDVNQLPLNPENL